MKEEKKKPLTDKVIDEETLEKVSGGVESELELNHVPNVANTDAKKHKNKRK